MLKDFIDAIRGDTCGVMGKRFTKCSNSCSSSGSSSSADFSSDSNTN